MPDIKMMETLSDLVSKVFQFDRLEKLSKRHPILAMSYMSLIFSLNAIITATGKITIDESKIWIFTFESATFEPTLSGKLAAMSAAYLAQVGKINDLITVETIGSLAEGIGFDMADMYKDTINALSKVIIAQTQETGKTIRATPEIIKALTAAGLL